MYHINGFVSTKHCHSFLSEDVVVPQWLFLAFMANDKTGKAQTTKYQVFINQTQSELEQELGVAETVDAYQGVYLVSATHFLSQKKEHR